MERAEGDPPIGKWVCGQEPADRLLVAGLGSPRRLAEPL